MKSPILSTFSRSFTLLSSAIPGNTEDSKLSRRTSATRQADRQLTGAVKASLLDWLEVNEQMSASMFILREGFSSEFAASRRMLEISLLPSARALACGTRSRVNIVEAPAFGTRKAIAEDQTGSLIYVKRYSRMLAAAAVDRVPARSSLVLCRPARLSRRHVMFRRPRIFDVYSPLLALFGAAIDGSNRRRRTAAQRLYRRSTRALRRCSICS